MVDLEARPCPPDPPVPSTPVVPAVLCVAARRLVVRPGPAGLAAASNRAVLIVCVVAARPCRHPPAPRPGPGLLYAAQLWLSIINFACNSPAACSNIEFASLELQRFLGLLKFSQIELHATFAYPGSTAAHQFRT